MRKLLTAASALALVIGIAATPAQANGKGEPANQNACYEIREDQPQFNQFLRYQATRQGNLTTQQEYLAFDHPVQTTFTVHGKSTQPVDDERYIGILNGTVIVGQHDLDDGGAVFGFTRDFLGQKFSDRSDCVSANGEASVTPETWICELIVVVPGDTPQDDPVMFVANAPLTNGLVYFDRVDTDTEPCSDFSIPFYEDPLPN